MHLPTSVSILLIQEQVTPQLFKIFIQCEILWVLKVSGRNKSGFVECGTVLGKLHIHKRLH